MGGNDEREQTLNQLLTEMDGFDASKGVVILAASNRPETLDQALLRPGRFDRRIPVELPDLKGREAILKVHAKNIQVDAHVDFGLIARSTSGASGAELANIINEAALGAVKHNRQSVLQEDLEEAVEVVIAGYQRKGAVINDREKRIIATHEIGHALVSANLKKAAPVHTPYLWRIGLHHAGRGRRKCVDDQGAGNGPYHHLYRRQSSGGSGVWRNYQRRFQRH